MTHFRHKTGNSVSPLGKLESVAKDFLRGTVLETGQEQSSTKIVSNTCLFGCWCGSIAFEVS